MTRNEADRYLNSFINYENQIKNITPSTFKLRRVENLLELLGNPHKKIKCIHVAGSKGKGSTCAFTAHILKEAGYKVGLYTSPHIYDLRERIRILKNPPVSPLVRGEDSAKNQIFDDSIAEKDLCSLLEKMRPSLEKARVDSEYGKLSYFEVLTALAFCYFHSSKIDYAVLETGMGGRLDATNVVDAWVCGLTPISLEHTQQLGSTLTAITQEKVAIVKNKNQIVVVAPQEPEALAVIEKHCQKIGAQWYDVARAKRIQKRRQDFREQIFSIKNDQHTYAAKTRLLGSHQLMNAATAIGLVEKLKAHDVSIEPEIVAKGIENTRWPGRFEIVGKRPWIILDCAHNPSSAARLAQTVLEIFPDQPVSLILGISSDKDIAGICRNLSAICKRVIFTKADHPRAYEISREELEKFFPGKHCRLAKNIEEALQAALANAGADAVIVVAGSIFIVAEARLHLLNKKG